MSVSGASASSFGSAVGSQASSRGRLEPRGGANRRDDEQEESSIETGIFGTLYTVSKEKSPKLGFVIFRTLLDLVQLLLLTINPNYGFDINRDDRAWKVFSFLQLNDFMMARGYTFFIILMYLMAVALVANVGLCIWVSRSFQANRFDHVWPITTLRVYSLVFFQVLDIASLTLFLMTMDCQYFDVPEDKRYRNQEFPEIACWSMPHLLHVAVAALSLVVFVIMALFFTMAEVELNPVSTNLLGQAHSKVEILGFGLKVVMTCATVFITNLKWMSVALAAASGYLAWLYFYWEPHLHSAVNYVRVGSYTAVFYSSILLIVLAFKPGVTDVDSLDRLRKSVTYALYGGLVPAALAGGLASYLRLRFFLVTVVKRFRDAAPDTKAKYIYKFSDPREVEIVSRCCRKWVAEDVLDEEVVALAERVIKAGLQLLPTCPYVVIWYSSFLIDVQGSYQSGYVQLQAAKKSHNPSILERFCLFIRDQEHTQKASAASSGDNNTVDLVSYVEFQRNHRLAMRLHMEALVAKRQFWECLMHSGVSFTMLSKAVARVDITVKAAERMYKQVLVRHSNSVKILMLYIKFLQTVKNDPWSASKWTAEAEKLQRQEEEANERAVFGDGNDTAGMQNHDDSKGVIIMRANCIVTMVNEAAIAMLGYGHKNELLGKNINVIVPPPFAKNHNNYVRNHIETGKGSVLGTLREFVALHKDRYVVPVTMYVTKVAGIGEDSVFMGIFQRVEHEPNTAMMWVMVNGGVLSCDGSFTDWLGYTQRDVHAAVAADLFVDPRPINDVLMKVRTARAMKKITSKSNESMTSQMHSEIQSKEWRVDNMQLKHMFSDVLVDVNITVKVGGIGETALYVFTMKRSESAKGLVLVSDSRGRITHTTSTLADLLGTTVSKLHASNTIHALDALLPPPFVRLHHAWCKEAPEEVPRWSCRSGLTVCLPKVTDFGVIPCPLKLHFSRKELPGKDVINVMRMEEQTMEGALDERRVLLVLDSRGVVTSASPSPASLYGFDPQSLVGQSIAYVVDVLRPNADAELVGQSQRGLNVLAHEEEAAKLLMSLAERSYSNPGISWRVGVSPIIDPVQLLVLGNMGATMMAERTRPAVMTVRGRLDSPRLEGARAVLPSGMNLEVALWRADVLSGVVELDAQGQVVQSGIKDMPFYCPSRMFGLSPLSFHGAHLSTFLPAPQGKSLQETLFTEGGLGLMPSKGGVGSTKPAGKSLMKGGNNRRRALGPAHHVKMTHLMDGDELELTVQAVTKTDLGSSSNVYLLLHLVAPRIGRPDFKAYMASGAKPSRPSASGSAHHSGRGEPHLSRNGTRRRSVSMPRIRNEGDPKARVGADMAGNLTGSFNLDAGLGSGKLMAIQLGGPEAAADAAKDAAGTRKGVRFGAQDSSLLEATPGKDVVDAEANEDTVEHDRRSDELEPAKKQAVKDRVALWMSGAAEPEPAPGASTLPDEAPMEDEEDDGDLDSMAEEEHGAVLIQKGHDHDQGSDGGHSEVEDLDEAATTSATNDFKRGKRYKKMVKLLSYTASHSVVVRLRMTAYGSLAALAAANLATFLTFYILISAQISHVVNLTNAANTAGYAIRMGIKSGAMSIVFNNQTVPGLRALSASKDYAYHLDRLQHMIEVMDFSHHGLYMGFTKSRRLPTDYGLRQLWEEPVLNLTMYYQSPDGPQPRIVPTSLWDAGNMQLSSARNLQKNSEGLLSRGMDYYNQTDALFIKQNAHSVLMPAYLETMDGMVHLAIRTSRDIDKIQLLVLALEGVVLSTTVVLCMVLAVRRTVAVRYAVYSVFMLVPSGLVRSLATNAVDLGVDEGDGEGDEEEDEEGRKMHNDEEAQEEPGNFDGTVSRQLGNKGDGAAGGKVELGVKKVNHMDLNNSGSNDLNKQSLAQRVLGAVLFWRTRSSVSPALASGKRVLKRSLRDTVFLVWPFMAWGFYVIFINAMGSNMDMSSHLATLNIINTALVRAHRQLFYIQSLVIAKDDGPFNKTFYHGALQREAEIFRKEYMAMLYGSEAVPEETADHYKLAKKGILFSQGSSVLYNLRDFCMCLHREMCQPANSTYYPFTSNGLDPLVKHVREMIKTLLDQPFEDINLKSPYFHFVWEVGLHDIDGGFDLVRHEYEGFINKEYMKILNLHASTLAVCFVMAALFLWFVLQPFISRASNETRRIAELLSSLPPEIDVEGMIKAIVRHPTYGKMPAAGEVEDKDLGSMKFG